MKKIKKLLVANRGEIACRIIRTCKRLGIKTVAVFSSADENALHRDLADESVHIGEAETAKSYLCVDKIIAAAKGAKADSIHPGYGFLAENADFSERLAIEGILFIGPGAESMRLVGNKISAKELAQKCGVPVVPGITLEGSSGARSASASKAAKFAGKAGFPLLIKAAGGGGGRGMRRVGDKEALAEALKSAQREAKAFFGDDRVFIEKLVENARHVEVQIIGDSRSFVTHLFDRDCSLQRNHQKVIEEAPAPNIDDELRSQIHRAAVKLGEAAAYINAGTVEFLLAPDGKFYFLEVNSRLQVEHPVTEAICSIDLVELQLRVAVGESLRDILPPLPLNYSVGHAIECRICAEVPEEGFAPATGRIGTFFVPADISGAAVRVDSGYRPGDQISHYYDSLLAKIIVHAHDRRSAICAIEACLLRTIIFGIRSNIGFLLNLLRCPDFRSVTHHTTVAQSFVSSGAQHERSEILAAALAALIPLVKNDLYSPDPWSSKDTWRISGPGTLRTAFTSGTREISLAIECSSDFEIRLADPSATNGDHKLAPPLFSISMPERSGAGYTYAVDGTRAFCSYAEYYDGSVWLATQDGTFCLKRVKRSLRAGTQDQSHSESIASPLPGKILDVRVSTGSKVNEGDALVVIESMKMEHILRAPKAGKVKSIMVNNGEIVESNTVLAKLEYS